jgi:ABC-type uncharacterized transport system fused permease/ATPase subunit
VRWRARGLFGLLTLFALAVNGLNVVNSYVGRDFMTAIEHRDQARLIREAILFVGVLVGSAVVAVLYRFTEERLGLCKDDRNCHKETALSELVRDVCLKLQKQKPHVP